MTITTSMDVPVDAIFTRFPKIARLRRDIVVTEKIDGTNAAVVIEDDGQVYAQSRKRFVTPVDDNFGFAAWVAGNAIELADILGPGTHFGEWWGNGIQRGYGMETRQFSLFNTGRWGDAEVTEWGLTVVPVLYEGTFSEEFINNSLTLLARCGSYASPGFMDPEGVVIYHTAANEMFKVTLQNDESPKALVAAA